MCSSAAVRICDDHCHTFYPPSATKAIGQKRILLFFAGRDQRAETSRL
jgi:hypothetical protein